jgi:hypothetical protein
VETKVLLPFSLEPASGPYPESAELNSHPHSLFLQDPFILSSHLRQGLKNSILQSSFPTKNLYLYFSSPHAYYMFRPSYASWCNHCKYTRWGVQLLITLFLQPPITSTLLYSHSCTDQFRLSENASHLYLGGDCFESRPGHPVFWDFTLPSSVPLVKIRDSSPALN